VRALKLNFGNVGEEEKQFKEKIDIIITIAEKVSDFCVKITYFCNDFASDFASISHSCCCCVTTV
jgi:hypothetical protein